MVPVFGSPACPHLSTDQDYLLALCINWAEVEEEGG